MTIRKLIVELFRESGGKPVSMKKVMSRCIEAGHMHQSVYDALSRMKLRGELLASGGQRSRRWHQTPTTAAPKTDTPRRPRKKREPTVAEVPELRESPFVHRLVPYGAWKVPESVQKAARWVFDIGGRA